MCCRVMHQHEQPIEQRKTSSMMIFSRHCTIRPVLCYPWGLQRLSRVQRSRGGNADPWYNVRGPRGYRESNDAVRKFLAFLETNVAFVCTTWFEEKNIHKQTWQHPKSKQWHCIDFIMMRQSDRKRCLDAAVMRGAECHTDHQLLCARVKVTEKGFHHKPAVRPKRFTVAN